MNKINKMLDATDILIKASFKAIWGNFTH